MGGFMVCYAGEGGKEVITAYYDGLFILSLVLTVVYVLMWHKHFDIHISLVFVLVPFTTLGNALLSKASTMEVALTANKLTYVGGCFLPLNMLLIIFSLCHIKINRWLRSGMLVASMLVFLSSLTMDSGSLFYTGVSFEKENGVSMLLNKQYGVMHDVFYGMVVLYFLTSMGAMAYSFFRKKQVSRKMIFLLFMPVAVAMLSFFGGRKLFRIELLPAAYVFAQFIYIVIAYRISMYDITDSAIDSLVQTGDTGFITFDNKFRYLGSNGTAKRIFPALNELTVDRPIDRNETMRETALRWLTDFKTDEKNNQVLSDQGDRDYLVNISYLYAGRRRRGYQFFITDDTLDQQHIRLLDHFNTELQREVAEKTEHIVQMHDQLIISMATMVESRDNSTGGHIRRTSEGVRLLMEEIMARGEMDIDETFRRNIIKAAPMHDLGKIAVDDAILRKPGRFTPEEFEKMKVHAAEGARIVHEILKDTGDYAFHIIAENVAHYHHERWDGSGYPQGLKGEEIPLEARIMAIADVYDALVSKRVYKDSMSFEKAHSIMMEGMGKQFDPRLEAYYLSARPKLEAYYTGLA